MARQVNQVLCNQWRQRIEGQRVSGLPIGVFCQKEGIAQASFYAWKRKFRQGTSVCQQAVKVPAARRPRRRSVVCSPRQMPRQLPARPIPAADFLQLPVRGVRSSPWIELSLVDGTLIRVPQENLTALTTLLRMLRGDDDAMLGREARRA